MNGENILLSFHDDEPQLKLIEFGYSNIQDNRDLSDEGGAAIAGQKRDVLSIASLFYEMMTGVRPFEHQRTTTVRFDDSGIQIRSFWFDSFSIDRPS